MWKVGGGAGVFLTVGSDCTSLAALLFALVLRFFFRLLLFFLLWSLSMSIEELETGTSEVLACPWICRFFLARRRRKVRFLLLEMVEVFVVVEPHIDDESLVSSELGDLRFEMVLSVPLSAKTFDRLFFFPKGEEIASLSRPNGDREALMGCSVAVMVAV